jgi:hypothetical protein
MGQRNVGHRTVGQRIGRIKRARDVVVTACMILGAAAPVAAQTPGSTGSSAERREIIIGGNAPPLPTIERCVDVQIGSDRAFGCLNQKLSREVDRVNPSLNLPPIDARSSDVRVGNVNEAAVRQQYGSNYGRSAFPYRPPPPLLVLPRR